MGSVFVRPAEVHLVGQFLTVLSYIRLSEVDAGMDSEILMYSTNKTREYM
jgi:hypothetical protein